jgi:enamine deaminase RidA (YjgF/YER057c/UK114 family)
MTGRLAQPSLDPEAACGQGDRRGSRLSEGVRKVGIPLWVVTKANGFVFVSGTLPFDLETGKLIRGDIEVQTEAALEIGSALLRQRQRRRSRQASGS